MPFGSTNAFATFKDYINKILANKLNVFIIVYFDDIFLQTGSEGKKHVKVVGEMLNELQKHLLYVNLKKCRFYNEEVRSLWYIISHQGIQMQE